MNTIEQMKNILLKSGFLSDEFPYGLSLSALEREIKEFLNIKPSIQLRERTKSKIGISNYKPFSKHMQSFNRKPITLIYGPNSVGKSSLAKSLLYLDTVRKQGDQHIQKVDRYGDSVDFGGFYSSIHKHRTEEKITFCIENTEGSVAFVHLFGFSKSDVHEYITLKNLDISMNDKTIEKIKVYIAFILDVQDKDPFSFDLSSKNFWHKQEKNLSLLVISNRYNKLLITESFIEYIKAFCYENLNNFLINNEVSYKSIENISSQQIQNIIDTFLADVSQYISTKYPTDIFEVASEKQRSFSATYTIGLSNIEIAYTIDSEKILKLTSSDDFDFEDLSMQTLGRFIEKEFKAGGLSIQSFEFYKHPLLEKVLPDNNDDDFFTLFDIKKVLNEWILYDNENKLEYKASLDQFENRLMQCPLLIAKDSQGFRFQVKGRSDLEYVNLFLNKVFSALEHIAGTEQYRYLGPLRYYPDRYFDFTHEDNIDNSSQESWLRLLKNDDMRRKLNVWLGGEKLKTPYQLEIQKIYDNNMVLGALSERETYTKEKIGKVLENTKPIKEILAFRDVKKDTIVSHRDMGLGISQILPILVNLFDDSSKKTLIIEQPELHLHPAIQSELADELIKSGGTGFSFNRSKSNIFVETHSEHLLLRMMKRMRQTAEGTLEDKDLKLTPDDICLLYVDSDGQNTYILELELDEDGTLLDPWPGGFFEEGFNERFF